MTVRDGGKAFGDRPVLAHWNVTLAPGERMALLGPAGCGQTTFLRMVAGLESPTTGSVEVTARRVGFVFQDARLIPWLSVRRNLAFVSSEDPTTLLERLGLAGVEHVFPGELSGGMRQRVNLARALLVRPDLLLLDEAFSSLDVGIKVGIMKDLVRLWQHHRFAVIMATHDPREAVLLADRVLVIRGHPAAVAEEIPISLPCWRSYADPDVGVLEGEILEKLFDSGSRAPETLSLERFFRV